jgi:hypothetical protein
MPSSTQIDRRTLIKILARGGLALSLTAGAAETVWSAIAADGAREPRVLTAAQSGMVARIADTILPRTDTPGAIDVGVLPWIDLVLAEYFSEARRSVFLGDLAAIDAFALAAAGAPVARLEEPALAKVIGTLDAASGSLDLTPPQRGYVHLKELIIHGYFTSKPVQQDILKFVIVPGRYDADAPLAPASRT